MTDHDSNGMASLKESLKKDISFLDGFFEMSKEEDEAHNEASSCWNEVREAAISFADMFDDICIKIMSEQKKFEEEKDGYSH